MPPVSRACAALRRLEGAHSPRSPICPLRGARRFQAGTTGFLAAPAVCGVASRRAALGRTARLTAARDTLCPAGPVVGVVVLSLGFPTRPTRCRPPTNVLAVSGGRTALGGFKRHRCCRLLAPYLSAPDVVPCCDRALWTRRFLPPSVTLVGGICPTGAQQRGGLCALLDLGSAVALVAGGGSPAVIAGLFTVLEVVPVGRCAATRLRLRLHFNLFYPTPRVGSY